MRAAVPALVVLSAASAGCIVAPWDPCAVWWGAECAYFGGVLARAEFAGPWDADRARAAFEAAGYADITAGPRVVNARLPDDPRGWLRAEGRTAPCDGQRCAADGPLVRVLLEAELAAPLGAYEPRDAAERRAAPLWAERGPEFEAAAAGFAARTGWPRDGNTTWQPMLAVH